MKKTLIMSVLFVSISTLPAFASETQISIPEMSFRCDYNNCNIGSGNRSCQLRDTNGGMVTINGVSSGQCNMFYGKIIIWQSGSKVMKSKVIESKEVSKW